jgi:UDP-3-O-acyl-N-acetylglucosamine deacetylase
MGLHTENKTVSIFNPTPNAEYGIRFVRMDLPNKPEIEAIWSNASSDLTMRGSVIKKDSVKIYRLNIIMFTCFAFGIDNLVVEVNNNGPQSSMFSKSL